MKLIVITGGGSGIGRALAQNLANRGKRVLVIGRHSDTLLATAATSSLISICCADVSSTEGRQTIVSSLASTPHIEALVHNAGTIEPIMPIATIDEQSWQHVLATNLTAPLLLTQSLLAQLTTSRVLHIGSGAAYFPVSGWAAYCVSKAALSMLTQCWQLEYRSAAFASVMPGIVDTGMQTLIRHSHLMEASQVDFYKMLKQEQRLLTPEVVALFLSWLLLDTSVDSYSAKEWDIYDTKHHSSWLVAPHCVPHFNAP